MSNICIDERENIVFDISWHPSGNYIATVSADGMLKVFKRCIESDKNKFVEISKKQREYTLRRVEFSPSGDKIVTAGFDKNCVIYEFNPSLKEPLKTIGTLKGQDSEIKSARWSKDEKYIITTSRDKTIYVFESDSYDFIAVHSGHTADVKDAAISPDGKFIVSVSFDESVRVWETKEELGSLQVFTNHEGTVWSLAFDDKSSFITLGEDGKIILYKQENDSFVLQKELVLQNPLEPLYSAFFSDGKWFVAGSKTKIFVIDHDLSNIERTISINQKGDINSIKQNPSNHSEIAVANDDGTVVLVNL